MPWPVDREPTGFQTHDSGTYSACESVILTTTVKTLGYTHSLIAQRGRGMGPEVLGRVNWTFPILPRLLVTLKMKISKAWSLGMPSPPWGAVSQRARYSAHCSIISLRFSIRSERAYAASALFLIVWARAISETSFAKSVFSCAQVLNDVLNRAAALAEWRQLLSA